MRSFRRRYTIANRNNPAFPKEALIAGARSRRRKRRRLQRSSSLRKNLETEPMFSQVRVEFWRWIELWSLRCGLRRAQFGDADQIVGDQVEQEIGSNSGDAAVLGLTHCTVLFAPAEDAFGHRPARLRDAVALVPRGASVDGAAATLAG